MPNRHTVSVLYVIMRIVHDKRHEGITGIVLARRHRIAYVYLFSADSVMSSPVI